MLKKSSLKSSAGDFTLSRATEDDTGQKAE